MPARVSHTQPALIYTYKPSDPAEIISRRNAMIGHWFSDQPTKEGSRRLTISRLNEDGTSEISIRVVRNDRIEGEQTEAGLWGISGPIYFVITQGWLEEGHVIPADPTDAFYFDAYEVLILNEEKRRYRSVVFGDVYESVRVPDDFQFPRP